MNDFEIKYFIPIMKFNSKNWSEVSYLNVTRQVKS